MVILEKLDKNNLKNFIIEKSTLFEDIPTRTQIEKAIKENGNGIYFIKCKIAHQYWIYYNETILILYKKRKLSTKELEKWIEKVKNY